MEAKLLEVRLHGIRYQARYIHSFEFRAVNGGELPAFTAGAHIDLHLPNGLIRSYSLANAPVERHRYVVGVNRDAKSRGGSAYVHDALKVGHVLQVSEPRNNFRLFEGAPHTVFIAGGIGVTPIRSMISRLEALGRSWELFYCARDRHSAAYLDELRAMGERVQTNLHFNFDQEPGGQLLDIAALVSRLNENTHVYCCGPLPMLAASKKQRPDYRRSACMLSTSTRRSSPQPKVDSRLSLRAPSGSSRWHAARRSSMRFWTRASMSLIPAWKAFAPPAKPACWEGCPITGTSSCPRRNRRRMIG